MTKNVYISLKLVKKRGNLMHWHCHFLQNVLYLFSNCSAYNLESVSSAYDYYRDHTISFKFDSVFKNEISFHSIPQDNFFLQRASDLQNPYV